MPYAILEQKLHIVSGTENKKKMRQTIDTKAVICYYINH